MCCTVLTFERAINEQVVKVIWHKAISPPNMDDSIVFARLRQCTVSSNTCFLGPTRVHISNGISIGSAVLQGSRLRQYDRQTNHAIPSVTMRPNNRPIILLRSCVFSCPSSTTCRTTTGEGLRCLVGRCRLRVSPQQ